MITHKSCTHKTAFPFKNNSPVNARKYSSILGLVVLILPKCPACIVSYTSAMTLCGSTTLTPYITHETDIKAYLALALGLLIVGSILYAFSRGRRVHLSLPTAMCGQMLLVVSLFQDQHLTYYYAGAVLLIVSTLLLGGSFHWKKQKAL